MITREFLGQFATLRPPGELDAIREVEQTLGVAFPEIYVDLILASDGLGVELDEFDVLIYGSGELVERNQTFETRKWLGDVLRIGDNGGAVGFHLVLATCQIVAVGDGSPSINEGWQVSKSLGDWVDSRFAVDYSLREAEHASYIPVRISLVQPLTTKDLAVLKQCLGLPESIMQLQKKCQELPVVLQHTRLDIVYAALVSYPQLAEVLIAEDQESDVQYPLT